MRSLKRNRVQLYHHIRTFLAISNYIQSFYPLLTVTMLHHLLINIVSCYSLALPDPRHQPVIAYSMNEQRAGDEGLAMRDYSHMPLHCHNIQSIRAYRR